MKINWTIYFESKYNFLLEMGKTDKDVLNIFKKNYKNNKENSNMWKLKKDRDEYEIMMIALAKTIKDKELLVG